MNGARIGTSRRWAAAGFTVCLLLPGPAVGAVTAGQEPGSGISTQRVDDATGSVLAVRLESDGSSVSTMSVGRVQLTKTVHVAGGLAIEVHNGIEALRVELEPGRLLVVSGGKQSELVTTRASADDYERIRAIVGASSLASIVRQVAGALSEKSVRSYEGLSFLHADMILTTLGGDHEAPKRYAQVLFQHRPELESGNELARQDSCFMRYKYEIVEAYDWVEGCYYEMEWWNVPGRQLCALEWTLRVQFAWAELLRCTALNPLPQ
jgi:hypothetical protein